MRIVKSFVFLNVYLFILNTNTRSRNETHKNTTKHYPVLTHVRILLVRYKTHRSLLYGLLVNSVRVCRNLIWRIRSSSKSSCRTLVRHENVRPLFSYYGAHGWRVQISRLDENYGNL